MKNASDDWEELRQKVLGLGEGSVRKTHYPSLRLRLSELERFRQLLDLSSDLLFVVEGPLGRILDASATALERLGIPRDELLTMSFAELVRPKAWGEILGLIGQIRGGIRRDGLVTAELRGRFTGEAIPVEIALRCAQEGQSELAIFAARDITEHQRAERRILKLNRLYEVITEVNKAIVKLQDQQALFQDICQLCVQRGQFRAAWIGVFAEGGTALYCEAWHASNTSMTPTRRVPATTPFVEVIRNGHHFTALSKDAPALFHLAEMPATTGSLAAVPFRLREDVVGTLMLWSDDPAIFDQEEMQLLNGVASDISFALEALDRESRRQRAERVRQEALARIEAILEASPLAIIALDTRGCVNSWTRSAERMFGWRAEEVQGLPNPLVPLGANYGKDQVRERVLAGEVFSGELKRQHKNGTLIDVQLSAAPLRSAAGNIIGLMAMYADISEHKRLQSQLWQAQKLESIGRLAGGVAHDFNNLLMIIHSYSEILTGRLESGTAARRDVDEILKAAQRGASLTRQMLAFSRNQILSPTTVDLNAALADATKMLKRLIGEDVEFHTSSSEDLWAVEADADQLVQVLMNLCVNARDAMPHGGRLSLEMRNVPAAEATLLLPSEENAGGDYVLLAVRDNGEGMDRERLERVFEPFYTTKEAGKGTGLGLSIVYGIVRQSGGYIWCESEPGGGACFTILLPRAKQKAVKAVEVKPQTVRTGNETLLVVEDERALRESLMEHLSSLGYHVLGAGDGEEALRVVAEHEGEVDLMISDVVMPKLSGYELSKRLAESYPQLRALFMSGYTDDVVARRGIMREGVGFLQKPFSLSKLVAKIRESLDRPR